MINSRLYYGLLLSFLATGLCAGCFTRTPPSVYYTLSPIEKPQLEAPQASSRAIAIGIGPIKFPDELDRPAIVTRTGRNRLLVNDFRRWGGSLEKNISRVMGENLALLMKTDRVMARPWERDFQPDVRIALDIRQFDGRLGDYAFLNVTWMVIRPESTGPLFVRRTIIQETVSDDGYDAFVEAQSLALARLCRDIADVLRDHFDSP